MTQTPKRKLKAGDPVMLPSGLVTELTDIQYEHNRYQLYAVSNWQYGIESLQPADWKAEALKWREEALRKYPTPEAYEAACAARDKHSARADIADAQLHALQIVANAETSRADRWGLAVKDLNDSLTAAEAALAEEKKVSAYHEKDAHEGYQREQQLKVAIECAIEEYGLWNDKSRAAEVIITELKRELSTLYPDTPAPTAKEDETND